MQTRKTKNKPESDVHRAPNPFAKQLASEGSETIITDNGVTIAYPTFTPERLRSVRQGLGLTQRQFGTALGFGGGANVRISEYESGKQPIPVQVSLLAWYMDKWGMYVLTAPESLDTKNTAILDILENASFALGKLKESLKNQATNNQ